jgi:hypothetical protein
MSGRERGARTLAAATAVAAAILCAPAAGLDRFLSLGAHLGRCRRRGWYAVAANPLDRSR